MTSNIRSKPGDVIWIHRYSDGTLERLRIRAWGVGEIERREAGENDWRLCTAYSIPKALVEWIARMRERKTRRRTDGE